MQANVTAGTNDCCPDYTETCLNVPISTLPTTPDWTTPRPPLKQEGEKKVSTALLKFSRF